MTEDPRIPDDALDALAAGRPSEAPEAAELAAFLSELREDAHATVPTPSRDLRLVLAEGINEATQGILTAAADADEGILTRGILTADADRGILTRGILTMRVRSRTMARVLVAKFMALGMLAKGGIAMAAVTAAATTAGATGVLPGPAQDVFDDLVNVQDSEDEGGTFGDDVSSDATGESDGEPGVDGTEVSCDASAGRAATCDDADGTDGPGDVGRSTADDASDGRSSARDENHDQLPADTPAGDTPAVDGPSERPSPAVGGADGEEPGGGPTDGGGEAPSDTGGPPSGGRGNAP